MLEPLTAPAPEVVQFLVDNRDDFTRVEGSGAAPDAAYLEAQLAWPAHRLYLTRSAGRVASLVMTGLHPKHGIPWIGFLLVGATNRRTGVGRAAAAAVEALWSSHGELQLAVLKTNPEGLRFWQAIGYQICDERPTRDGAPCWVVRKEIGHG